MDGSTTLQTPASQNYTPAGQGFIARWRFRGHAPGPEQQQLALAERVLLARGLSGPDASTFLEPRLTQLHDPSLIPDLDRAAARLLHAATTGEPIVVYGDYDVDGVTGASILYHMLRCLAPQAQVSTYVPHRLDEGYGLHNEAMTELAARGAKVVVSVDCGITAVAPARVARSLGLDLIITDHHNPPRRMEDLPDAYAVVHPRRPDSAYPFGELSGAGVAYKLAWRLATLHAGGPRVGPDVRELLVELLAMAALGAIADIVPLVDENRVIARFGLARVKHSRNIGLRALVEASGLAGEKIDSIDVGFRLAPRLNASGRMGHAREAMELFATADPARAAEIAATLSEQNEQRQAVERRIFETADQMAAAAGMTGPDRRAIVLAHPEWHPGVVGIVCSRLVEKHSRPVILLASKDGHCHGSARSIEGFDLHAALERCSEHLDKFGGHRMAAGMHLAEPKLGAFTDAFVAHASGLIAADDMCRHLTIDCRARLDELTPQAVSGLERLEPCGAGNPESRILLEDVVIADRPSLLGAQGKHLAIQLGTSGAGSPPRRLRVVAWNFAPHAGKIAAGVRVDAVVKPRLSVWNGTERVEPELCDLRIRTSGSQSPA